VSIRDPKTGNGASTRIDTPDADVEAICKGLAADLKKHAKRTRRAIAVERAMGRE
jgi:hypothetical protein